MQPPARRAPPSAIMCARIGSPAQWTALLSLAVGLLAVGAQPSQKQCDWASFGSGSAAVNKACCADHGAACADGLPKTCTSACRAVYLPFHNSCAGFIKANLPPAQVTVFAKILGECQVAPKATGLVQRGSPPLSWWQGDGSVFVGKPSSTAFAPCTPVFLYDAGRHDAGGVDCLNGLPGVHDIALQPNHNYPQTPINGCPPNPTSGPGGHWYEAPPKNGKHYFANVLSGDTGGWNSWGVDDDTSDGGQYQTFSHKLNHARVKEAFAIGWVMRARVKLVSCTTVSTYLFAFQGGSGADRFRYLPYICDDDVTQIGDKTQRNKGGIAVGEYMRPGATLNPAQFKKNEYHLYELVYDPRNAKSANKKDHGISCTVRD
jgi:hypothetical protein